MTQTLLSAASILDAEDLSEETVDVPEWGGAVRLCQMTAEETREFTKHMSTIQGEEDGMFLMLVYSARDVERKMIFTVEDVARLRKKNINVLNRLQRIALRLNKMGDAGEAALKKD